MPKSVKIHFNRSKFIPIHSRFSVVLTNIQKWIKIFVRNFNVIVEYSTIDSTLFRIQVNGFEFIFSWNNGQLNESLEFQVKTLGALIVWCVIFGLMFELTMMLFCSKLIPVRLTTW